MITPRRALERRHVQRGKQDTLLTFFPQDRPGPATVAFGYLETFDEMRLPPGKDAGPDYAHEHKRFTAAQLHNVLCVVAPLDGRKGSLRIHQDALIYSSVLDPGHHIIHELLPGRSAWLHVICGEAILPDIILSQGDGVGITLEPSVSLTAQENTEILLVDSGPAPRLSGRVDGG